MSKHFFFALRPKHWVKNLFVFMPLIFGKKLFDAQALALSAQAFVFFCMASSAVYLMNDLLDFAADRLHPSKRLRPIAAGRVARSYAVFTAASLALVSVVLAFHMNARVGGVVAVYLIFNVLYSRLLKHLVIIDVFCLSFFFILRLLAGTYAPDVALSHWILVMGGLLALFLGFNKRRQELKMLGKVSVQHRSVLRKYSCYFIDQMISVVTASTVVAYTFYTVDDRTVGEFGSNHMLFTVPFVYYGIFRYLYLLHQRRTDGDPTRVLLGDFPMQVNLVLWIFTAIAVVYFKI